MEVGHLLANPRYAVSRCGRVFSFSKNGRCRERKVQIHRSHATATPYRMLAVSIDGREASAAEPQSSRLLMWRRFARLKTRPGC